VKGSYLLGLAVPGAYYASEMLESWLRSAARIPIAGALGALALAIALTFTYGLVFEKAERPGFGQKIVPLRAELESRAPAFVQSVALETAA
jgi:hypothetical protein